MVALRVGAPQDNPAASPYRRGVRPILLALLLTLTAGVAVAQDWGKVATVSSTMGISANQLCLGEGSRGDIGCPAYAPSVNAAGNMIVSGSVAATSFLGDGSGLTNVGAATTDRIVSGSTSMLAISSSGYISLTQAGTNTGWFDPTRGLVTIGVSSTGPISGTGLYVNGLSTLAGKVGIGGAPSTGGGAILLVTGIAQTTGGFSTANGTAYAWGGSTYITGNNAAGSIDLFTAGASRLHADSAGNIGIGTGTSSATLHVSGSLMVTSGSVTAPGLYVSSTNGFVGIGTASPSGQLEISNPNGATSLYITSAPTNASQIYMGNTSNRSAGFINYSSAAQTMAFTTNSAERMRINSNGYMGIGTTSPSVPLEVSGTVSATQFTGKFVGDGSGLINVGGASADRIVSNTTSMLAMGTTGYVSLTQAGTNTGWFDPTRGLVTIGVSSTGPISGTNGYFAGAVGINGAAPNGTYPLYVNGRIYATSDIYTTSNYYINANSGAINWLNGSTSIFGDGNVNKFITFTTSSTEAMRIVSSGFVGVGTSAPSAKLEVVGSVSATNVSASGVIAAAGSVQALLDAAHGSAVGAKLYGSGSGGQLDLISGGTTYTRFIPGGASYIATPGTLAIGKSAGVAASTALEVAGTVSATAFVGDGSGLTGIVGASADRIVSGTTSMLAISNTGYISITQAGTNTGWFDPTLGLVTIGVSSTGPISGTNGYFAGRVGIGVPPDPTRSLTTLSSIFAGGSITAGGDLNLRVSRDREHGFQRIVSNDFRGS